MSLSIRQNLGSAEAAAAYNQRIYDYRSDFALKGGRGSPGCISALACPHCYHVISDSICLCVGYFVCPNCGKENRSKPEMQPVLTGPLQIRTAPVWTNAQPTAPGWYWYQDPILSSRMNSPTVVRVFRGQIDGLLRVWQAGAPGVLVDDYGWHIKEDRRWYGPLEQPVDS